MPAAGPEAQVVERLAGYVDAECVKRRHRVGPEVEAETTGTKLRGLLIDLYVVAVALQGERRCQSGNTGSNDRDPHA
jgi:hypothetical protein